MKNAYEISIVIPNFNNAKYISECIESIERQTYPIKKVIVVDDCSTDGSVFLLRKLCKRYSNLTIVALDKNGKVSHARNCGLQLVETPYVTFIDADDVYYNHSKISNEMMLIKEYKEKSGKNVVAYSAIANITKNGLLQNAIKYKQRYYLQGNIYEEVLTSKNTFTIMRDYCMPTECIRLVQGYNEKNCLYEDLELILKLAKRLEFVYTGEWGTAYRQTQNGLSSRPIKEHTVKLREIFEAEIQPLPIARKMYYRIVRRFHLMYNFCFLFQRRVARKIKKVIKEK